MTFGELARSVERVAGRLADRGVGRGDRLAVLVPPSVELVALVYACWRAGAVTVIADRGLGLGGLGRAVRGARVDAVVGERRALVAARTLRWAPSARPIDLDELVAVGPPTDRPTGSGERSDAGRVEPGVDDLAAILFTSGATGPAKGVRYTHGQLARQRDALTELYAIAADDRFVAAFAPFALYGPALGITSAVPDVDVTRPGALTAGALDAACAAVDATMVFASPAALANVVRTANGPLPALGRVRTVMSAGAPVPVRTLRAMSALTPAAELHTPYGMTESLPVADVELDDLARVEGRGVCVGRPVPGCEVRIVALAGDGSFDPTPGDATSALAVGVTGEVLVRSPWTSAGYDGLWRTERAARPADADGRRWHRSGDIGHLDDDGRLWIEGRSVHVVWTVDGPVTSVPAEIAVERLDGVERAAVVGVGPSGVQRLVVVVEADDRRERRAMFPPRRGPVHPVLASLELTGRVRAELAPLPIAAVCTVDALPTDIRHEAKIDRALVADRVGRLLAGRRP